MGRGGAHTHDKIWNNHLEEHTHKIGTSAILGEVLPRGRVGVGGDLMNDSPVPTSSNFALGEFSDGWMKMRM